jgi:cardiolipin synthase
MLLDDFGSAKFSKSLNMRIKEAGIFYRRFSPVWTTKGPKFSLRLHHKLLLVDGKTAIIGGINIADKYHGIANFKEWLDFAVLIKGPVCSDFLEIARKLWNKKFTAKKNRSLEKIENPEFFENGLKVKVIQNNWYRRKLEIFKSYRTAIWSSHDKIILVASYFLPGGKNRRLLRKASRRGVDINIMLAAESDVPVFKRATNYLYGFLLRNNIKIFEYKHANVHAKAATFDGKLSTIGSYNLNHLSNFGSIELNVNILDSTFSKNFENLLAGILEKDCHQITMEDYMKRRTWFSKFADWFSYIFVRLMLKLVFFFRSEEK